MKELVHGLLTVLALSTLISSCGRGGELESTLAPPTEPVSAGGRTSVCESQGEPSVIATTVDLSAFGNPLCVSWQHTLSDEEGFVILLRFLQTGETFEHRLPSGSHSFRFPQDEQPSCQRGAYQVELRVVRKGASEPFSGFASQGSCGP